MYKFIKNINENCKITEDDIREFEKNFSLQLTDELKEYLLKYNGGTNYQCIYTDKHKNSYVILKLLPMKFKPSERGITIEDAMKLSIELNERFNDKYLPKEYVPIAYDPGGEFYYYDVINRDVIFFFSECWDMEKPSSGIRFLCNGLSEFLDKLEIDEKLL